jgi:hypothetical protein
MRCDITYTDNGGLNIDHSMVIEARRRFSKGVSHSAAHTWGGKIADVGVNRKLREVIQNPNDRSAEGGPKPTPLHKDLYRSIGNTWPRLLFEKARRLLHAESGGQSTIGRHENPAST